MINAQGILQPIYANCSFCNILLSTSCFMRGRIIHKETYFFNLGEYFVQSCRDCYEERTKNDSRKKDSKANRTKIIS